MTPGSSKNRTAAGLPPITAAKIAAKATRLTARSGLDGWSLRDLAAELDVYPAVIYHHLGDREAVLQAVTERVVMQIPVPPIDLPWREWFTSLLCDGRVVLRKYPGVARRLSVSGPTAPSALRIINRGVTVLQQAGFGDQSVGIYSFLIGTGFLHIQLEDERSGQLRERLAARDVFIAQRHRKDSPGLEALATQLVSQGREAADLAATDAAAYQAVVALCLDGAESRLPPSDRRDRAAVGAC